MLLEYTPEQLLLLPPNLEELLPEGHLARIISLAVDKLDINNIIRKYNSIEGRPAYHPAMMLKIIFYSYTKGIRSSRQIAKNLESDTAYMWLSGMQRPDFRTISDFRKDNLAELKEQFVQIIRLCMALGMVNLRHASIDGTKIKANAGKGKMRDREGLKREIKKISKEVEAILSEAELADRSEDAQYGTENRGDEIPTELKEKQKLVEKIEQLMEEMEAEKTCSKVNLTDKDARLMKNSDGGYEVAYNAQAVVDGEELVIIACGVTNEPMDLNQLEPMLEQVKENARNLPKELSADSGYYSGRNLSICKEQGVEAFISRSRGDEGTLTEEDKGDTSGFTKKDFRYDAGRDIYVCPAGEFLYHTNTMERKSKYSSRQISYYRGKACAECSLRNQCMPEQRGNRRIDRDGYEELRAEMRDRLAMDDGKAKYRKRKCIVEPVFGQIKYIQGVMEFLLRQIEKVKAEWRLVCLAHNLRKIWSWASRDKGNMGMLMACQI